MFAAVTNIERLKSAITKVVPAVGKNDSSPIESYIKVEFLEGRLRFVAVDSTSHQLVMDVPADVADTGVTLVNGMILARKVGSLVASSPAHLFLEDEGTQFKVEQESDSHNVPIYSGEHKLFPEIVALPELQATLSTESLKQMLTKLRAIKTDPGQSVGMQLSGESLTLYTNDNSLYYRHRVPMQGSTELSVRVPVASLLKMPELTEPINVHLERTLLVFHSPEGSFWVQGTPGSPTQTNVDVIFDRERMGYWITRNAALGAKLNSVVISRTIATPARVHIDGPSATGVLDVPDQIAGGSTVTLPVVDVADQVPDVMINATGLKNSLTCLKQELVMIEYLTHMDRILLRMRNEDDPNSPCILLMPIHMGA